MLSAGTSIRITHLPRTLPYFPSSLSILSRRPRSPHTVTFSKTNPESLTDPVNRKFGFTRPEMYKISISGTVEPPYERHVFLCHGNPATWPARVEDTNEYSLPKALSSEVKSRRSDIGIETRLTICEGREGSGFPEGDVLIFPEMIKYRGLKVSDVDKFVEDVLVKRIPWAFGMKEAFTGSYVFVCAHGSRDKRCGVCGPVLIDKFMEEIELRGLHDQVFVIPCSHIGGHHFAGNLIIFSSNPNDKIMGHWYGYVTPDDIPDFFDRHIEKGEIIEKLWRGQMGVKKLGSAEGVKKSD